MTSQAGSPAAAAGHDVGADRRGLRFYRVTSGDGTRLRAWTNDADGPVVLLCNGLATNPHTWPALLSEAAGVRVISWDHRGVGGSERPADPARVDIHTFVEDAVAVLDDAGVDRCVVAGWSMGVNTAFQLAVDHPERVSGLFAIGGVPGDTFATMLGPLPLPRWARRALTVNTARLLRLAAPLLNPLARRVPVNGVTSALLRHSGFVLPRANDADVRLAMKEFLTTPVDWYMHMAVAASRHLRVSLSSIDVPALFVAGRFDMLAGPRQMRTAAARMRDGRYILLNASHFIPLEYSAECLDLLRDFVGRVSRSR